MKTDVLTPRTDRRTKHLDLEGGIRLTEDVKESESGDVRARFNRISWNGNDFTTVFWKDPTAGPTRRSQSYWRDGKLLLSDEDEDGDGVFDLLIVWNDAVLPLHAFNKTKDGRLVPVTEARLNEMQKECRFMKGIMTPIIEGAKRGMSEEESLRVTKDAIRKAKKGM